MQIVSHRGLWSQPLQQNTIQSFLSAAKLGCGIEVDVHLQGNQIVISHDPPTDSAAHLSELLEALEGISPFIALNIKQDGLGIHVKSLIDQFHDFNMVAFDMSIPQMIIYEKLNIPFFTRLSEIEVNPIMLDTATGLWVDSFSGAYPSLEILRAPLDSGKLVSVVSPELHGRPAEPLWAILDELANEENLMICTDFPLEALDRWGQ